MTDDSNGKLYLTKRCGQVRSDIEKETGTYYRSGVSTNVKAEKSSLQTWGKFITHTLAPVCALVIFPNQIILLWYTIVHCHGSYMNMLTVFTEKSVLSGLSHIWGLTRYPSPLIVCTLIIYCIYALVMMKLLPGKKFNGPITQNGNVPEYKDNGFLFFFVTMVIFWSLTFLLHPFGFTPSIYYDRFDEILITLIVFSFVFCVLLYLKGRIAPSSSDSGSSGNFIFDFYWGMELYPRIFGFDVKVFTNCRFGLMIWALMVCIHVIKSYELHGFVDSMFVSAVLQIVYLGKFYWWEAGYMSTIDIMLDRAGYMICWGCLTYVPGFYTSVSYYLVNHPVHLGLPLTITLILLGMLSVYINYAADAQKQIVRRTNGECLIWGKKPEIIRAKYQIDVGLTKENILLASGWWGVSRHFHYIPEILLAFLWTLPAGFDSFMPYSYVVFICLLLSQRAFRDDLKCEAKYGLFWKQYCQKVSYRIIPNVY